MSDIEPTALLAYYAERQVAPQWRGFLAALAEELFENIPADQASGFLRQVGLRMAHAQPLPVVATLEAVEVEANKALAALDWGVVRLVAGEDAVRITHAAFPSRVEPATEETQGPWPRAFGAVIEGLYTGWLLGQGAGACLRATLSSEPTWQGLELAYKAA